MAVDFTAGWYRPYDAAAVRFARGGVDARPGWDPLRASPELGVAMNRLPAVAIRAACQRSAFASAAAVIDTAVARIHESGTALRMDDVPLPLARAIDGPPATAKTVASLAARLRLAE